MMAFSASVILMKSLNVAPSVRLGLAIGFSSSQGVSGRDPEQDAQPFLRVAVGGLEKWWWTRGTPKGFRAYSAHLAVSPNDLDSIVLHICCQLCVIVCTFRW
jgi:hypothetical protein